MKSKALLIVIFLNSSVFSQDVKIDYYPVQKENISDEDYRIGTMNLRNTYERMKANNKEISSTSYWNIATGYARLGQAPELIERLLIKSQELDNESFCASINLSLEMAGGDETKLRFYSVLGEKFSQFVEDCKGIEAPNLKLSDLMKEKEQVDLTLLNEPLVNRLIIMHEKDQRHRRGSLAELRENAEEQNRLDKEVSKELFEIFTEFGYPGKDIVGETYKDYACIFLEHTAELEDQENYLPLVINAFKDKQLTLVPVQMLIDRIYTTKTGKQIFGSQAGYPYDTTKSIEDVKRKYGL